MVSSRAIDGKLADLPYGTLSELHAQIEQLADEGLADGSGSEAQKRFFSTVKQP
jgi:hypothetical protein